jgi:hypothetical protein
LTDSFSLVKNRGKLKKKTQKIAAENLKLPKEKFKSMGLIQGKSNIHEILGNAIKDECDIIVTCKKHMLTIHTVFGDECDIESELCIPAIANRIEWLKVLDTKPSPSCHVLIKLGPLHIGFLSHFVGPWERGFKLSTPSKMFQLEQRKYRRLQIPSGQPIDVFLRVPDVEKVIERRKLLDISAGGLSFVVSEDELNRYVPKLNIPSIELAIRGMDIKAKGAVANVTDYKDRLRGRGTKVGIEFFDLDEGSFTLITSFVAEQLLQYSKHL